jgi:carbon storage regulator CsrA
VVAQDGFGEGDQNMLVLSRRSDETITFPQLGISVTIVSVKGNRVQVGVQAPPAIQILRKELGAPLSEGASMGVGAVGAISLRNDPEKSNHEFKNKLNQATLGLQLAQRQLAAGQSVAADKTLEIALARLDDLEKSKSVEKATSSHAEARYQSASRRSKPIDILLVEDDMNEQSLLREILEMEGYRVRTARDGLDAIQCLEQLRPDCVLMDMVMPRCDGPEAVRRMKSDATLASLPIFLPVGNDGVIDWFPKPLNAARLIERIRDQVDA